MSALRQQLLETRDVGKRLERVAAEIVAMTARLVAPGVAQLSAAATRA